MKKKSRRYEVQLPARYNDGREVSDELLGEALEELIEQFQAVGYHKDAVEGYWRHGERLYVDNLGLLVVDVPDTAENRKWMKAFKAKWKARLEQLEIWMVSYRIEIE